MSYGALDIFQRLRQEDVHWILASSELKTISVGSVLVREDDPSDRIFFIADGLFEVYVFAGHRIKVGQLGPGEVIGEISWLDRKPVSASVQALETSAVLVAEHGPARAQARRGFGLRNPLPARAGDADRRAPAQDDLRGAPLRMGRRAASGRSDRGRQRRRAAARSQSSRRSLPRPRRPPARAAARLRTSTLRRCAKPSMPWSSRAAPRAARWSSGVGDALKAELLPLVQLSETGSALLLQAARLCRRLSDPGDDLQATRRPAPASHRRPRRLHAEPRRGEGHPQPPPSAGGRDPLLLHGRFQGIPCRQSRLRAGSARSSTCSIGPTIAAACR